MDPVSLMMGVSGLALKAFGAFGSVSAAQAQEKAQEQQIGLERQGENVRSDYMEVTSRRESLQALRNNQRARSMALNSSTNQGAQQGSGLSGGYGQIAGMSNTNLAGIDQNLQFGRQTFGINEQISQTKIDQAKAGSQAATAQGWSSLGGSLIGGMGMGKQLAGSFGPSANPGIFSPFSLNAG